MKKAELIVALDVDTFQEAEILIDSLDAVVDIFKVGSQLFTACGPGIVYHLINRGKKVFLDLKFHDIPNTVANAVASVVKLSDEKQGLLMCTLHTVGGADMLKQALSAAEKTAQNLGIKRPFLVGITVLTSEDKADNITPLVLERARLAKACGLDGVVVSSQEAALIRRELGEDFVIVTPGIRPAGTDAQDQKRVATPLFAVQNGSHFLVVGRPIVKAENPLEAAKQILQEIQQAQT